ncbi:phosphoglycerate kinase, cytosolic isoform X2 [Cryptomeria japonica]|uniref:phosphoglycerate kinase, cytosolic isoform X2 n=1 Tax=Cryptomeria japonica TaxID=3369 RepID=UPI0025AD4DCC|nr:phosphoglycerate kinase, cytosolic isoform X2 [Cryptomeria japonica]
MELSYCLAICPCNPSLFTSQPHLVSKHKICIPPSSLRKVAVFQNVSSYTTVFPHVFKRRYSARNSKISIPSSTPSQVVFCTRGELNPCLSFQTLKTFPREELLGKVVMVRFDSKLCPRDNQFISEYPNDNAIKTLKYLCDFGAKVVIATHWFMSKISGEVFSTWTLADYLSISLGKKITAIEGVIGDKVENSIDKMQIGDILLLGNLSQYKEEVANCKDFARNLSARIDILVNDTFCDSHRVLASTVGVARFTYASIAGFHLADIMSLLTETIEKPKHPFIAIVGGAKIMEKISVIRSLLHKCDTVAFIGTMSFTFLSALGLSISPCFVEKHAQEQGLELLDIAKQRSVRVLLPKDFWCTNAAHSYEHIQVFEAECIPEGWRPIEIGPDSLNEISFVLKECKAYPRKLDWKAIFRNPLQPLVVDIGSGNGLFALRMARMYEHMNFLGLEINSKLVERSLGCALELGLMNVYFVSTNATTSFCSIISSYPGALYLVSIQCPNPDFVDPEHRWRMVQRSLIEAIVELICKDGKIFLQSDVKEVALRMKNQFLQYGRGKVIMSAEHDECDKEIWLGNNPFSIFSDWEQHVIASGRPMYRVMLSKCIDIETSD